MSPKYDIFKEYSDGSFVWIEAVEDIIAARQSTPKTSTTWEPCEHWFGTLLPRSSSRKLL